MNHTFAWHTGRPIKGGTYIVIDKPWGQQTMGAWVPGYGWCIRGRWLGLDAVTHWTHQLPMPTGGDDELRHDAPISQRGQR